MMSRRPLAAALALLLCPGIALGASAGLMPPARMQKGTTCTPVPGVGLRCSDGRVSTTVRATVAQCETAPGVWTDAAVNQACVNWRGGLEAWGANTSYISNGGDLSNAAWEEQSGAVLATGAGYVTISRLEGGSSSAGLRSQVVSGIGSSTYTVACRVRPAPTTNARLWLLSAVSPTLNLAAGWSTISHSGAPGVDGRIIVYPGASSSAAASIDAKACWLTKTATPGRPVWCGTAPCTVAADVHTISTSGWPTSSGRMRITFTAGPAGTTRIVLDGRSAVGAGTLLYVADTEQLVLNASGTFLTGGTVPAGTNVAEIVRDGTTTRLLLNGVQVATSGTAPAWSWVAQSFLGTVFNGTGGSSLNGAISRLSWSAK